MAAHLHAGLSAEPPRSVIFPCRSQGRRSGNNVRRDVARHPRSIMALAFRVHPRTVRVAQIARSLTAAAHMLPRLQQTQ